MKALYCKPFLELRKTIYVTSSQHIYGLNWTEQVQQERETPTHMCSEPHHADANQEARKTLFAHVLSEQLSFRLMTAISLVFSSYKTVQPWVHCPYHHDERKNSTATYIHL